MRDDGDALLDGQRRAAAPEDDGQRLLRPDVEELLAAVDVEQQVGVRRGEADLLDGAVRREALLAVVAVEDAGPGALGGEAQERDGALGVDEVAGDDEDERGAPG